MSPTCKFPSQTPPRKLLTLYESGAHAPSYLYRIVADHYKPEDVNFHKPELQF
jgi:translation initiation factor eIF-2B subunit beta